MTEKAEERIIKGEVESWSAEVHQFSKNKRGSRGVKIEGDWHNLIDETSVLDEASTKFPKGSYVQFVEKLNNRGYWDIKGTIISITKQEAYKEENKTVVHEEIEIKDDPKPFINETGKEIKLQVCLKSAIKLVPLFFQEDLNNEKMIEFVEKTTKELYIALKNTKKELKILNQW